MKRTLLLTLLLIAWPWTVKGHEPDSGTWSEWSIKEYTVDSGFFIPQPLPEHRVPIETLIFYGESFWKLDTLIQPTTTIQIDSVFIFDRVDTTWVKPRATTKTRT